ncbi:MAG: sensor histidine kinase N-terminal domain-containing protein [Ideonella sp.]|nr:sensor histidine kinase N-terminal domain-containing protein [Ideonella sp.]MBP6778786.1 sensor histidine kinase N-terminal domain-containing protein [Piscinibacter sp.]
MSRKQPLSLRSQLLIGILLPVLALLAFNAVGLYRQALRAADTAYDRTLLASAKAIGEELHLSGSGDAAQVQATVPYSALEAFEADNRSRMFFKVSGFQGEMVSGFPDFPPWRGSLPAKGPYAALVDFYDDAYRGQPVRVAVLLQPVAGVEGQGMATIQVAETLELRQTLARQILLDTLWRQAALLAVVTAVVVLVVQRATRPVRELSAQLRQRSDNDLAPIDASRSPRELLPLLDATNQVMARLAHLLAYQKRFVRDTAHQLRTPLAVLRTQLQSAQRGDVEPAQALHELGATVERATTLANQMLALAKVEQLRQQGGTTRLDWDAIVRAVALDLSALIAEHHLDFEIETEPAPVSAHEWALRELARNLLHNAIKHSPPGGRLSVRVACDDANHAVLTIADSGPGIAPELRLRLFQPFAAGDARSGSGLGLAICHEIVASLGGAIRLVNREAGGRIEGLDAIVELPLAQNVAA